MACLWVRTIWCRRVRYHVGNYLDDGVQDARCHLLLTLLPGSEMSGKIKIRFTSGRALCEWGHTVFGSFPLLCLCVGGRACNVTNSALVPLTSRALCTGMIEPSAGIPEHNSAHAHYGAEEEA